MIRRVGVVSKPEQKKIPPILRQLLPWLEERGVEAALDQVTARYLKKEGDFPREQPPHDLDLMIVLGGDGTLLSVARGIGPLETPILAVNLGGLGFMMTTGPRELLQHLECVLAGDYEIQTRKVLRAEVVRGGDILCKYFALNDAVVNKAAVARLLELDAYVDEDFICSYRADGLIISTPTGSTAYSLSAGGPVMLPSVSGICLTPICPHTLTNRAVLIPETSVIEVYIRRGDDSSYLTVDGQVGVNLRLHDKVRARRARHRVRIIQPKRVRFFEVLRSKMKWG